MPLTIRKNKRSPFWYARGTVPTKNPDGTIGRVRIEESLRTERAAEARQRAADLEKHYHDLAFGKVQKRGPTFAEAALTYLQVRGKHDRFLPRLLQFFGETPIAEIDQAAVAGAAHALYPDAKASTHNRAVYAPIVTILRLSGERPALVRPRIAKHETAIPPDAWFDAVIAASPARLAALLVFITLTGARITEACDAVLNEDGKSVTIPQTKLGKPAVVELPDRCLELLALAKPSPSRRLFGYADRHNVYRTLKPICKRLGLPWFPPHSAGRHSFATRHLREGRSTKWVAVAGRWKSTRMVDTIYGHLEQSDIKDQLRESQERWSKKRTL